MRVRRAVALVVSTLLVLAGAAAVWAGVVARGRLDPDHLGDWRIVRRGEGEAVFHDLVRNGIVELSLGASVDMCDPPVVALIDVNGDGSLDLYHRHCRGHEYVRVVRGKLVEVNLGQFDVADAPVLESFWGGEIFDWRGLRLVAAGGAALLVGLFALMVLGLTGRRRARSA